MVVSCFLDFCNCDCSRCFHLTDNCACFNMRRVWRYQRVNHKDVYFCMIFSFLFFFFKRSMQILIKIPTGSIQEIEYFTFSYIHGSWLFILWFHCGFCNKKGTFRVFTGFGHLQTSEKSGRNMTVELDSRHPLLPKAEWGKLRFYSDLKGIKIETLQIQVLSMLV